MNVDGARASTRDIDTVGDALRRLDQNSLRGVDQELASVESTVGDLVGTAAKFAAATLSIGAFVVTINSGIDALAELDDMAQKTGSSVENLSRLQKIAEMTEQDFGAVDAAIEKLARGMGGLDQDSNKVLAALGRLGVSATDASGKMREPAQVLIEAAGAMQQYSDGAGKTALANDLLSKGGASLLPFLNDVAENIDKVNGASAASAARASQFKDNLGALKMRLGEVGLSLTEAVLPHLVRLSEYAQQLADSGKFKEWADATVGAFATLARTIDQVASVLVPAAKIAATYFAVFVAAPAAISAVGAAFLGLYGAVGRVIVAVSTAGVRTGLLNTALWGTSVSATLASGALTKVQLAASLLFAAVAGWQIGTYLREEFAEARVAGLFFVSGLLTGWENIKHGAQLAWEGIGYAWDVTVSKMAKAFIAYLTVVQKGFSAIGAKESAAEVGKYIESLRGAAADQNSFEQRTSKMRAAHEKELRAIENTTAELVAYELSLEGVAAAKKKVADVDPNKKELKGPADPDVKKRAEDARKARDQAAEERAKVEADYAASLAKTVEDANKEAEANEELVRTFGMTKKAIAELDVARLEARLTQLRSTEGAENEAAALELVIAAKKRSAVAVGELGTKEAGTDVERARALLEVMSAVDDAAREAAKGMAASFGTVGDAIGGLTTALSGFAKEQAAIAAQLKIAVKDAGGDTVKIQQANTDAAQRSAQAQVRSYGNIATAAKGFFKENSTGYKVMEGAEKAFRAAEMAMAMQAMVKKIFFKEGEVAANLALNSTKLAGEASTTAASNGLAASEASAWGITAVVKAIASMPFPANLAAGAATLAAVIAIGAKMMGGVGGGGGGGQSAAEMQKVQGTGGVFGDSSAKSNSIARSLELLEDNSANLIPINQGMLSALRAIEASMSGLTNLLVRTPGLTDGSNIATDSVRLNGSKIVDSSKFFGGLGPMGSLMGGLAASILGKTTRTVTDAGLQFGGSVRSLQNGQGYSQYANIETTKSRAFGLSKKTTNSTETQRLNGELSAQFGLIFKNVETALTSAAVGMGIGADRVKRSLDALTIDVTKISLKGLSGEALTEALNAVISKTMDDMAQAVIPQMDAFRQVGEGYAQTVIRIASNYANLDVALQSIGMTFGATGVASIAARESLISMLGGIDEVAGKAASFADNFLTQAERLAPVQKYVADQMQAMGLASIDTREEFKRYVLALNLNDAAQRQQYVSLMQLQEAFAQVHAATVDLTKSAQEVADERQDLMDQYDELTMTSVQLLNKQRLALDASNRSLFDQVQAAKAVKVAQDSAKKSLGDFASRMTTFADSARAQATALLTGGLSTLTLEEQYNEMRNQYRTTVAAARSGDAKAQANFAQIQSAFLTISQKVNGSDSTYAADFASAVKNSNELADWADNQVDLAEAGLEAMNKQVLGMGNLNLSMLGVALGLKELSSSLLNQPVFASPLDFSKFGAPGTESLVVELKAVKAELAALRQDQNQQTGAIIQAQVGATQRAAETISTNARQAAVDTIWQARNVKVQLA